MAFPTPKFSFRSDGVRAFLARQVLLFVVAAALFAILWVTGVRGPGLGFVPILYDANHESGQPVVCAPPPSV
jgi:hypothetical protein